MITAIEQVKKYIVKPRIQSKNEMMFPVIDTSFLSMNRNWQGINLPLFAVAELTGTFAWEPRYMAHLLCQNRLHDNPVLDTVTFELTLTLREAEIDFEIHNCCGGQGWDKNFERFLYKAFNLPTSLSGTGKWTKNCFSFFKKKPTSAEITAFEFKPIVSNPLSLPILCKIASLIPLFQFLYLITPAESWSITKVPPKADPIVVGLKADDDKVYFCFAFDIDEEKQRVDFVKFIQG